jgi:hypothetical protein
VATESRVQIGVPYLSSIALAALLAGFVALAGGILLMTSRVRGAGHQEVPGMAVAAS